MLAHAITPSVSNGVGGGSGPAPPASIPAVHYDWAESATYTASPLQNASGTIPSTAKVTVSFVIRGLALNGQSNRVMTNSFADFVGAIAGVGEGGEITRGQSCVIDTAQGDGTFRVNLVDADQNQCQAVIAPGNLPSSMLTGGYTTITYSFDGSATGTVNKLFVLAMNGVEMVNGTTAVQFSGSSPDPTRAFLIPNNVNGWQICNFASDNHFTVDVAEVAVWFGQSIVGSDNHFVSGSLSQFVDGSGNPKSLGSTPTINGVAPDLLFNGAASGFGVNKGTVTNTFTTTGLTDAAFSPGQSTAGRAYPIAMYSEIVGGALTTVTTGTSAIPVLAGDIIVQGLMLTESSGTPTNHNPPVPTGYTALDRRAPTNNTLMTSVLAWKKAAADGESTVVTWPTWTGTSVNGATWFVAVYRGADGTSPMDAHDVAGWGEVSNVTSVVAPSVSPASAAGLLNTVIFGWGEDHFTLPTGMGRRLTNFGHTRNSVALFTQQLSASGATGTRTSTASQADGGHAYTFVLKPA